jgi:hypothetical protein
MSADLIEEHSTATLATERLEAEQSERMRFEKEKGELEVIVWMETSVLEARKCVMLICSSKMSVEK